MSFCGFLRGNTAATIKLGPFLDSTDGNTDETALTISQADVRLSKNGGDYAQKNDSNAATHDEIGMYDCAINATDTNTYGRLRVTVHESGALTVDQTYMVLPEIVFDSLYPSAAGNPLPIFGIMDWGTAQASAAGTLVHRSGLSLADDILNGATETIYGGTGAGQARVIHDFTNSSDTSNISPNWTTTPSTDSLYATVATPPASTSAPLAANVTQLGGDAQSATDLKDFADAGYDPSTNKVQGVVLADTVTTYTGNTPQTGDSFARLGAPAGASHAADTAAVKADTASLKTAQYQKNVAAANIPVYMVTSADPTAPATGLTLTVTRSIDGGAFASATGTAAEISAGLYQFDASQADMNGDDIVFKFAGTGAVTRILHISTYT